MYEFKTKRKKNEISLSISVWISPIKKVRLLKNGQTSRKGAHCWASELE